MTEKLQKVLARAGLASRREIEKWIDMGRVTVNGMPAKLGDRVDDQAFIRVDGKPVKLMSVDKLARRVLLYNKPIGEICTAYDPEGRDSVFDHLPPLDEGRWVMVGRLDINTCGLLLFTNDGELANQLMHPSHHVERRYSVRVLGTVTDAMLEKMQEGVLLEDGLAHFDSIEAGAGDGANHWYHVTVKEGRNRIVRRIWESQGVTVSRLMRVGYGKIALPRSLRAGDWVELRDVRLP
jgi:23S rRNA pseudouridine2605 synthase